MLSKVVIMLAAVSLTYLALRSIADRDKDAGLEREVERQLEALREHLFRR